MQSALSRNRPEIDLLLNCARTRPDSETDERILGLVQNGVDWTFLFYSAFRHGVLPLLHQTLNKVCPRAVPDGTKEQLRKFSLENGRRNLYLAAELLKVLDILEGHGIFAVPFKGPVLAESVYGDLSLRGFVDLDILVHKRDAINARNCLLSRV